MSVRRIGLAEGAVAALASAGAVALVTAAIAVAKPYVPVLSLGVLYVFAVLPVAVAWGLVFAVPVSVASMLAFNWFFLPPVHTFTLRDSENWFALAVYVVTALVVSELAARARRRATEAEQRETEMALLAEIAATLLQGTAVNAELESINRRVADVLHARSASIVLGDGDEAATVAAPIELRAGNRHVGTLTLLEGSEASLATRRRLLPGLASLLAVAIDRERLAAEAFDAEALRRS